MGIICVEFSDQTDDKIGLVAVMLSMTPQEVIIRFVEHSLKSLDAKTPKEPEDARLKDDTAKKRVCPHCAGDIESTERRLDGNSVCVNGHTFPTRLSVPLVVI